MARREYSSLGITMKRSSTWCLLRFGGTDEPTSGLDSQTAWSICVLLRKLVDQGQAILCTIHQPSAQIFEMFDRLLLLSCQGQTLYFGDIGTHATSVINYFEAKGATKFPGAPANPAEWMLEVTNGDSFDHVSGKCISSAQGHQSTSQRSGATKEKNVDEIESPGVPGHENEYAVSLPRQLFLVTKQICIEYWRDPSYMYSKMALCTGLVSKHIGPGCSSSQGPYIPLASLPLQP